MKRIRRTGLAFITLLAGAPLSAQPSSRQELDLFDLSGPPASPNLHRMARPKGPYGKPQAVSARWPVLGNVAVDAGILPVTGAQVRERDFKRIDPMIDVKPRPKNVAAVGLSLSF